MTILGVIGNVLMGVGWGDNSSDEDPTYEDLELQIEDMELLLEDNDLQFLTFAEMLELSE